MQHHQDFYPDNNDEIDLFELFEKLWQEKFLILGITALAGFMAIAVALLLPKEFSAEAIINETTDARLAKVNAVTTLVPQASRVDSGIEAVITKNRVYDDYRIQLTRADTFKNAVKQSKLTKAIITENNDNLSISFDNNRQNPSKRITIRHTSDNADEPAYLINNILLPYVSRLVTTALEEDRRALINKEKNQLNLAIQNIEQAFLNNNKVEQAELEEALKQASAANIEELTSIDPNPLSSNDSQYLLGTRLLTARLSVIKDRFNQYRFYSNSKPNDHNKPYITEVANKVSLLEQLEQIETDYADIEPVIIEQYAETPLIANKPNKKLIVALGLVAGGMFGVFLALIRIAVRSRKEKKLLETKELVS